jgi:hypothetical protein
LTLLGDFVSKPNQHHFIFGAKPHECLDSFLCPCHEDFLPRLWVMLAMVHLLFILDWLARRVGYAAQIAFAAFSGFVSGFLKGLLGQRCE